MTDHAYTIREALLTLFEADADTKAGGNQGVRRWWRRVEDGLNGRQTPFCYIEYQGRTWDEQSDDLANVGYVYNFEIGVVAEGASKDLYKADDKVTTIMDKIEDVLLENRSVSSNVDNLAVPIEHEMVRANFGREDLYGDVTWGVLRLGFHKSVTARQ